MSKLISGDDFHSYLIRAGRVMLDHELFADQIIDLAAVITVIIIIITVLHLAHGIEDDVPFLDQDFLPVVDDDVAFVFGKSLPAFPADLLENAAGHVLDDNVRARLADVPIPPVHDRLLEGHVADPKVSQNLTGCLVFSFECSFLDLKIASSVYHKPRLS